MPRECKHPNCGSRELYLEGYCYADFKRSDRTRGGEPAAAPRRLVVNPVIDLAGEHNDEGDDE